MRIDILTVVPDLLTTPLNESILRRAQEKGRGEDDQQADPLPGAAA